MFHDKADLASDAVKWALHLGASDAECTIIQEITTTITVRNERLIDLRRSQANSCSIHVLNGHRSGCSSTSRLTRAALRNTVEWANTAATLATPDECLSLPDRTELVMESFPVLRPPSENVAAIDTNWAVMTACRAERAMREYSPLITGTDGVTCSWRIESRTFTNSSGVLASYSNSLCSLQISAIASTTESMERATWSTSGRDQRALEMPEQMGICVAQRAISKLGPKPIRTQRCTVLFEPNAAQVLIDHLSEALNGLAVMRSRSFLVGKMDHKIASDELTLINDPTIPGLVGSYPFDAEGVTSRRTVLIDKGRLSAYLLNWYAAKRLGSKTTGSAIRGFSGRTGVGYSNLFVQPSAGSKKSDESGLQVSDIVGNSFNQATGDLSFSVTGHWLDNGFVAYPVSHSAISCNVEALMTNISQVGCNVSSFGLILVPSLTVRDVLVTGRPIDS